MIPIRDTIPSRRPAVVVRLLVVANIAVFVWELMRGGSVTALIYRFGVVPSSWALTRVSDVVEWPRLLTTLVTSQFLHGGLLHLGFNMLYLWIFGDNVEDRFGRGRFLVLYLGSGAAAALTQLFMDPSSSVPMIGASGAIAGVLGAYFLLFPFARIVTLLPIFFVWEFIEVPAFVFLGFWFFLQWLQGVTTLGLVAHTGGIAWWAHVGGFVTGFLLVLVFRPQRHHF